MLKLLVKHFIYEACISVLFQTIVDNFSKVSSGKNYTKVELGNMTFIIYENNEKPTEIYVDGQRKFV